jgi:hypothetical protein
MMSREVMRYAFKTSLPADEIEGTLLLAVFAAEGLHGQSRVRLEAAYNFDSEKRACVVDATSDVGRDICRIFTALAIREYGEEAFSVRRAERAPEGRKEEVPA